MPTYWTRTDSNNAQNPALNTTGDDAVLIEFVTSGTDGDLILEVPAGGGTDPDTQVMIGGTAYDFTYEISGTLPTTNNNGANQIPTQFQGTEVFVITVIDYPTAGDTTRLYFFPNESATEAEMNSIGNGAVSVQNLDTTPGPSPVCFASGTMIQTPDGEVPVETLRIGDLVDTLDHGPQPVLWAACTTHTWPGSDDGFKPISIGADAFGPGLPARRLVVSPQHRILLSGPAVELHHDTSQVLGPARGLTSRPKIRVMKGRRKVTYCHLLLPMHAVVYAEGLPSESFFPGETAIEMLTTDGRRGLTRALRTAGIRAAADYGCGARPFLTVRQTRELAHCLDLLPAPTHHPVQRYCA